MSAVRTMLTGGDRRSIGRTDEVVALIHEQPGQLARLVECLWDEDPLVTMRAANALEKVSRDHSARMQRFKPQLLGLLATENQPHVKWQLALIVPRLRLTAPECGRVFDLLQGYLDDRSSIVRTFAMQGLADLTRQQAASLPVVIDLLRALTRTGTPAMRARGRILLRDLAP